MTVKSFVKWAPDLYPELAIVMLYYRQTSNISSTKAQNTNVSHLVLQSLLPNPVKPGVKWRIKM